MNVWCSWCVFVWGMMGLGASASGGSKGKLSVHSMLGRLKSPVIQISVCLSACVKEKVEGCVSTRRRW